eukprot:scaffold1236_cov116-Isochrysis_galbana.AAC.10
MGFLPRRWPAPSVSVATSRHRTRGGARGGRRHRPPAGQGDGGCAASQAHLQPRARPERPAAPAGGAVLAGARSRVAGGRPC